MLAPQGDRSRSGPGVGQFRSTLSNPVLRQSTRQIQICQEDHQTNIQQRNLDIHSISALGYGVIISQPVRRPCSPDARVAACPWHSNRPRPLAVLDRRLRVILNSPVARLFAGQSVAADHRLGPRWTISEAMVAGNRRIAHAVFIDGVPYDGIHASGMDVGAPIPSSLLVQSRELSDSSSTPLLAGKTRP